MKITKAVIPAAGMGTRFLPFTKTMPKEMLPILNRPAIEYIIEEGIKAGFHDFKIIANDEKKAIIDHFKRDQKLEETLAKKNRLHLLSDTNRLIENSSIVAINQPEPRGLGHALLMARDAVGDEYFGVFLPDDIILSNEPAIAQLAKIAREYNATVIGVQQITDESISAYGVVKIKEKINNKLCTVAHLVEKPAFSDAPSDLAVIGRYILSPDIFNAIDAITPHAQGEIQLTDAINYLVDSGHTVIACAIEGKRFDTGQPVGWIKANIEYARNNSAIAPQINHLLAPQSDK